jgi:heterodisulfide reductase subunit C
MAIVLQLFFISLIGLVVWQAQKRIGFIARNIQLGKPENRTDQPLKRWATMVLVALGQKKMFDRPIVAFLHLLIYVGFVLINIELLEIVLDGILGTHRLFAPLLGAFYAFLINSFEVLGLAVLLSCVAFLARRNVLKISRFWKPEMTEWPRTDANLILIAEIVLMSLFLTMNAADVALQELGNPHYFPTGRFIITGYLVPFFTEIPVGILEVLERSAWWLHIVGILSFAIYVTYSKHLHIILAFPNTYFSRLNEAGEINNMASVTNEVKIALGLPDADPNAEAPTRFGAKDIQDLSWKNLMDAYSCTECGRCTSVCPANLTGKKLSPRKIMMDTRDRMEEVGLQLDKNQPEDGKSLYGDYIAKEELIACTTCNACVDACPININPLDIIIDLRRYVAMEESGTPASWNNMFVNVENNAAPWAFPASDRLNWKTQAEA